MNKCDCERDLQTVESEIGMTDLVYRLARESGNIELARRTNDVLYE